MKKVIIKPKYVNSKQLALLKSKKLKIYENTESTFSRMCYAEDFAKEVNGTWSKSGYDNDGEVYSVIYEDEIDFKELEQWQVIDWLWIKHGIHITTNISHNMNSFSAYVMHKKIGGWDSKEYNTPQKAISAAIDYVLKKLI